MQERPQILVTRPEPDASDTAARLDALGFEPVLAPLLLMKVLETGLPEPQGLGAIALTSANALRALEERGQLEQFLSLPVFTVGNRTAAHARAAGFTNVTSADGTFEDLVALLGKQKLTGPIFYPTAANATGDLAKALAPTGVMVLPARVYEMRAATELPQKIVESLAAGRIKAVSLYSRRTAETFCALAEKHIGKDVRTNLTALCLSENVAAPMIASHFTRIALADYPSEEAMMALALSVVRHQIR